MDNKMGDWEQKSSLVNELTMGRELARQLQIHLSARSSSSSSSSSQETSEMLVQQVLGSYEKALSMLNCSTNISPPVPDPPPQLPVIAIGMSESPPSLSGSPRSEDSDRDQDNRSDGSRKRKSVPRWTRQVRVTPGMGLEGPLDDGFSWRKYGQKDILGAKYPRGYYRCTHRNVQGCLATKQVQRSDEDPTIFEVTYRGRHTCTQASHIHQGPGSVNSQPQPPRENHPQEPNNNDSTANNTIISIPSHQPHQESINQQASQLELLSKFRTNLKVVTDDPQKDSRQKSPFPSFHFPSTPLNNNIMFSPSVGDNTNLMMVNFPNTSFASPSTSSGTSSYFSAVSHHQNQSGIIMNQPQNFQNTNDQSESELNHIITDTSAANPPAVGFDQLTSENVEFDNLSFGNPGFHF